MKRLNLLAGVAMALSLATATPAGAVEASGEVELTVHSHSSGPLLFPSDRLPYNFVVGDTFSYSSRRCSANAPFNDLGLNFDPDYPGVDDDDGTAPSRHHVEGTITSMAHGRGRIEGTITTVLCVPGQSANGQVESPNVIVSHFRATFSRKSNNDLYIVGTYKFDPVQSTGTFEDLEGRGVIHARFTCLGALTNPAAPTCAQLGEFHDFVSSVGDPTARPGELLPGMNGSFRDPTAGRSPDLAG